MRKLWIVLSVVGIISCGAMEEVVKHGKEITVKIEDGILELRDVGADKLEQLREYGAESYDKLSIGAERHYLVLRDGTSEVVLDVRDLGHEAFLSIRDLFTVKDGEDGEDGEEGKQGTKGDTGETGAVGPQGEVGAAGPQGIPGGQGIAGPEGDPGLSSIIEVIDLCDNGKEILLRLDDDVLIAFFTARQFKDNGNRHDDIDYLSTLSPGNYITTDGEACSFEVNGDMSVTWN